MNEGLSKHDSNDFAGFPVLAKFKLHFAVDLKTQTRKLERSEILVHSAPIDQSNTDMHEASIWGRRTNSR
jgi:hypothetical protein